MAVTSKTFKHYQANMTPGFVYDESCVDITPAHDKENHIMAMYDIQIDGGPVLESKCTAAVHLGGDAPTIDAALEANAGV